MNTNLFDNNTAIRPFKPNKNFRREYNKLFKKDPLTANTLLLLCELANEKGQVKTDPKEIAELMAIRFNDPCKEYALTGGGR